jgi:hypothetical protein
MPRKDDKKQQPIAAGGIKKQDFSALKKITSKYSSVAKYKEQEYFLIDEPFYEQSGLPGPAKGHINMFLGHSDTGKTTAMVKSAVACQKKGVLPVFIITEQKWSWEHAKIMGLEFDEVVDETTGEIEYEGFFIFNNSLKTIEQIAEYMNGMIDEQTKEAIPYELTFLWDSIGSVPCQMTFEGKGGKMHNAGVLADVIGMGLNDRITGSRTTDSKYTNTLIIVNQPWVKVDMKNVMSQPKIKAKGGESVYLNSTLVFLFGNQQDAGISKVDATKDGRKIAYATRSKVSVIKNHINGLGYLDGKIIVTPHGFLRDDPDEIKKYKAEHSDYWQTILGDGDYTLVNTEVVKPVKEIHNNEE